MNKMYIFVRKDLAPMYRMVQGAHALAQYAIELPEQFEEWNNETIVFIEVKHDGQLMTLKNVLAHRHISFSKFFEPDHNNELTAIACYSEEEQFKKYNMAK